jgi:ligand-binding SRPBCC domain-containing protein
MHLIHRLQLVRRPIAEVFSFFSKAENLEMLTPPFLRFRILSSLPIRIQKGTQIDYRIRLFGIPLRWRARIREFVQDRFFIDEQERGPYRKWTHLHTFREVPGGTEVGDVVHYELPLGTFGKLAHPLFVRNTLEQIFDYRQEQTALFLPPLGMTHSVT